MARALPNRFNEPGPFQLNGVYGDRTVKITVFNRPPDGGTSNSVSLRVQAKWLAGGSRSHTPLQYIWNHWTTLDGQSGLVLSVHLP